MVAYGRLMQRSPGKPSAAPIGAANASDRATRIATRAPSRIDFGGGWTDVPPYPERDGGFVCNVAISRYAHVRLGPDQATTDPLGAAALRRAGLAAGLAITSDFPVGAGLGGSSAAGVAIQAALAHRAGERVDRETLVRRSRAVEVEELGIAGGWQDHYAAAYGGALALEFSGETRVTRIDLAPATREALERRCLLLYTGETRISGSNITAVLDAYARREPGVIEALARMGALAREMAAALANADLDALGALVGEHWVHQRALHPAITTERIDAIHERAMAAGALGVKALGASGGGCVAILTPEDADPVRDAISSLGMMMSYSIDTDGATIEWAQ